MREMIGLPAGRAIKIPPTITYDQFCERAWLAFRELVGNSRHRDSVSIPRLRRAMVDISFRDFSEHLLRMERNELVYLIPPECPEALSAGDRRDSLVHPDGEVRSFAVFAGGKPRAVFPFWD